MSFRGRIGLLAVAVGIALVLRLLLHWSWFISLFVPFVGWPLGGTLVTIDDDLRGGWSNPDGTVRPQWLQSRFWGQIAAGIALSALGAAFDAGWQSVDAKAWGLTFLATALLAGLLIWRPWHKAREDVA